MMNAPRTDAEKAVQDAITNLWYQTYTSPLTTEQRNAKASDFIARYLEDGKINAATALFYHPNTAKKVKQRSANIYEILGDYILRVDQVAENSEEYPITSQETEVENAKRRKKRERVMVSLSVEDTADENYRPPKYSVKESDIETTSLEDEVFAETKPTVEKFRKQLEHVKAHASKYAERYERLGYEYSYTVRRISLLSVDRVRECRVCGEPFHAHDRRREICDLQHGRTTKGERSDSSTCELIADRQRSEETRRKPVKTT